MRYLPLAQVVVGGRSWWSIELHVRERTEREREGGGAKERERDLTRE
jgi:hypothetical protein